MPKSARSIINWMQMNAKRLKEFQQKFCFFLIIKCLRSLLRPANILIERRMHILGFINAHFVIQHKLMDYLHVQWDRKIFTIVMIITLDSFICRWIKIQQFHHQIVVRFAPYLDFKIVYFNLCQFSNIKYDVVANKKKLKKFMVDGDKREQRIGGWVLNYLEDISG